MQQVSGSATQTIPEIGQLVIVRKRPFVVTEIVPAAPGLSGSPLINAYSGEAGHRFHAKLDTHSRASWTVGA